MASKKKTSVYADHGTVGPAEELDTYGVWVKSEPQDLTAGFETANFDAEAVPYEADFDSDFGNLGLSESDFADLGDDFPPLGGEDDDAGFASDSFDNDSFATGSFDDDMAAVGRGSDEASTQFLMKIAGELSSIRSELNTLKREFADIRAESGKPEPADDFFADGEETEEDEKIALTGDEMENFLASADFSGGDDFSSDPQRDADEAALKELSEQNELAASETGENPPEDIEIDFDNLGVNLDEGMEVEAEPEPELEAATPEDFFSLPEEAPEETASEDTIEEEALQEAGTPPDTPLDDEFDALSFDSLSFDSDDLGVAALGEDGIQEASAEDDFADDLVPLVSEEDEELQNLRREGATPHTPAPDNSHYLENDPFIGTSDFEEISDETVTEEAAPEEIATEEIATEEIATEEIATEEVSDEISEITTEEVSTEEAAAEAAVAEDIASVEDASSVEDVDSSEDVSSVEDASSVDDAPSEEGDVVTEADSSFDDINFDLNIDETDNFAEIAPLEEEPAVVEETPAEEEPVVEEAVETVEDAGIPPLEEEPVVEEAVAEEPAAETVEEVAADPLAEDFDIVSDEPDFSAGIVDTPVEEPSEDDLSFGDLSFDDDASFDDVSFDMDDFGEIEPAKPDEPEPSGGLVADEAEAKAEEPAAADTEIADDSLTLDEPAEVIASDATAEADDLSGGDFDLNPDLADSDFDMDGFGDDLVLDDTPPAEPKTQAKAESKPVSRDNSAVSMDQIIPEGFEINAQEAAISSDDLEAALPEEDLSIASADAVSSETPAVAAAPAGTDGDTGISAGLKTELVSVLSYLDNLLASLPEDKMKEFAKSEYFDSYQKIFKELGLV